VSEEAQSGRSEYNIDDIVAQARARSKVSSREALPQMSTPEILGGPIENKTFSSYDDMEASQSRRDLPAAEENVKTLGDLMAKYHVGEDPDFKALLYRTWPKVFAGGVLAEGYYATYDQPITEQTIAEEYGGGHYRVAIHGPRPHSTHGTKHYASTILKIAGEPRTDRVPNRGVGAVPGTGAPPHQPYQPPPSDAMVDKAFTTLQSIYSDERTERLTSRAEAEQRQQEARREAEHRQSEAERVSRESMNNVGAIYEKFTRDVIESERASHERERRLTEERVREREDRLKETEQRHAEERRRHEDERRTAPDPLDSVGRIAELFKGDGGASQQRILDSVLTKHREEIALFREESARATERIREANSHEAAAIRDASRREVEAERMASSTRERELLRQIESAREERARDADRYREDLLNRDQAAKDRLEQQRETISMQQESRYKTLEQQGELRITYLRDELERKTHELEELRSTAREDKDPRTTMLRMKEFQNTAKEVFGFEDPRQHGVGSESTPVPATTTSIDYGKVFEGLMEKGPEYLDAIGKLLRGPPQAAQVGQPPPQPGQILQLPHGTFQVVQTPGGLGMIPYNPPQPTPTRLANPQRQRALPAPQPQRPPQPRPQSMPGVDEVPPEQPQSKPQRHRQPAPRTQKPAPQPIPAAVAAPPALKPPRPPPTDMEKQAAQVIGNLLNTAIMQGDEPEDLLASIVDKFPAEMLQAVAQYDVGDIMGLIREFQPNSAVFTPGGVIFTQTVFQQLRATVKS